MNDLTDYLLLIQHYHGHLADFWGNGGHAPAPAAAKLRDSNLRLSADLAAELSQWSDAASRTDGARVLAWIALGSLTESALMWFLCVYDHDYDSQPIRDKAGKIIEQDDIFFHRLIEYFDKTCCGGLPSRGVWPRRLHTIRKERNAIHVFSARTPAPWSDWEASIHDYACLLAELESRLPDYPDEQFAYPAELYQLLHTLDLEPR